MVVGDYNYLDTDCKSNQKPQQPSKGKKIINVFENFHSLDIQLKYIPLFFLFVKPDFLIEVSKSDLAET